MKKTITVTLLLFLLFLTGCNSSGMKDDSSNDGKLQVYTTVYPLKYFTEEIGKEYVKVETIYPPGSDEHTFEPSQKDMMKLADSDLFIYVGLGLEGFVNKAEQTLKNEEVTLLAAGENIDNLEAHDEEEHGHGDEHEHEHHGDVDPHVWIDPLYSKDLAEAIKNELISQLPEQKEQLEENYNVLIKKLDELDTKFENLTTNAKHKEIIVSHAAYGYWEERYGIKQTSISGLSSSSEPTQKELKQIIQSAKENEVKYIFFEQNVSSKLAEIVRDEMDAEPLMLHNLSVLTDEDIKNNRTYFSIMDDNLKALETALQ